MQEKETTTSKQCGWKFVVLRHSLGTAVPLKPAKSHLHQLLMNDSYILYLDH